MAAAPPTIVRIKRKRDEPPLPEFVLASKRPSLARLTLDDGDGDGTRVPHPGAGAPGSAAQGASNDGNTKAAAAGTQRESASSSRRTKYRLVNGAGTAQQATAAREQAVKQQQSASRQRRIVAMRRTAGAAGTPDVLELQLDDAASSANGSAKPKLRPFGPPLPKSAPPPPPEPVEPADEAALLDSIWADAAAAATLGGGDSDSDRGTFPGATMGDKDDDGYVIDEYVVGDDDLPEQGSGAGAPGWDAGWEPPEIWFEEVMDADLVSQLEAEAGFGGGGASDSEGEVDYPDEESGGDDDDDDDERPYRRGGGFGGAHESRAALFL